MSKRLREKIRKRVAAENGTAETRWGGRLAVALVYPNSYHNGMSNLGFQSVYHLLNNRDDALCERFFLPDREDLDEHCRTGTPLFSYESGRALADFDLVAFSISFENDYLNLPAIFELGRMPLYADERGDNYPLVLAGGVCAFLNPEPLAGIFDLFAIGEAESILPELVVTLNRPAEEQESWPARLAGVPGIYVPRLVEPEYDSEGRISRFAVKEDIEFPVRRRWLDNLDNSQSRSFVQTGETEFGDMALTEISRGCSRGCRFCAAGFLYLPVRERSLENLEKQIRAGLEQHCRQGLVSAAVGDYSQLGQLTDYILGNGGEISVASLRMDTVTGADVEALKRSGHKTVTLAPEAGSQRLRDVINKGVSEDEILAAVKLIAAAGLPNLKLYFLYGLPTETDDDINAIAELTLAIREAWLAEGKKQGRLGQISLSLNSFVPKPFTPFQWAAMETEPSLKKKVRRLRSALSRIPNVSTSFEPVRSALLQGLLSRGDRRIGRLLPELANGIGYGRACRDAEIDIDALLHRERGINEIFPWEVLDCGVRRDYLRREYELALAAQATLRCFEGCARCGIC